jgi:glycosyltransferase involved in cell wall biosynthesis
MKIFTARLLKNLVSFSILMREKNKPRILILSDYYLPGYKSGGGMRTIVNMIDRLKDEFDFWIITRDHDGKLDKETYKTVQINDWNFVNGAKVFYLPKDKIKISKIHELILEVKANSIYTNSYFATLAIYLLVLRSLGLLGNLTVIVAPCGELSDGALQIKSLKKKLFIKIANIFGLYKNIYWKASNELEKLEIEKVKGKGGKIFIAPDLTPRILFENYRQELKPVKKSGEVRMVFLSRFARKKNFKWLLEILKSIKGKLRIDVYGPIEDKAYWLECLEVIKTLPPNINIKAKGSVSHENSIKTMFDYHFFILPTLGENFGHVFLEALAGGCPLIISDKTPWVNLEEKNIGWAISLNELEKWKSVINKCINMDNVTYAHMSVSSRKFVSDWLKDPKIEESTLDLLTATSSAN